MGGGGGGGGLWGLQPPYNFVTVGLDPPPLIILKLHTVFPRSDAAATINFPAGTSGHYSRAVSNPGRHQLYFTR